MGTVFRVTIVSTMVVAAALVAYGDTSEKAVPAFDDAALLVIDIQAFYFPEGMVPLVAPEAAAEKARKLIDAFRKAGRPVIHVQHLPKGVDTPDPTGIEAQYRIHPEVLPQKGEMLIGKHHANSFRDTALLNDLRKLGIKKVVVIGMQTHMCVEAAVRAAADLGFEVTVAHDACATRDLTFDGVTVPAAQVHAAALAAMNGSYATVVSTSELCEVSP